MYFPYFYGRGAELLALRDVAGTLASSPGGGQKVFPIIESLQANAGPLKKALDALRAAGMKVFVITNPCHEELASATNNAAWMLALSADLADPLVVLPTFMVTANTQRSELRAFLTQYPIQDIGIVLRRDSINPNDLQKELGSRKALVFLHRACDPSQYEAVLPASACVRVSESFVPEERNADYGPAELFSDEVSTFLAKGHPGFSDFTLLPKGIPKLSKGGLASAVAIHLSFINPSTNHIWVHHYVSDTTQRSEGSIGSKFLEALDKLDGDLTRNPGKYVPTFGIGALKAFQAMRKETNLATSKRHQITHHLETVHSIL
ncbi:sce7725 family protein [Arthrobacter sp. efr-133-R2A-120]|uniref:sce7725 family protein n=1 Tax=Arthrobacter sp. efr-133-R2A-120 TaxID=3040277 RepID=UPI00254B0440|nr:sce7725 family protein [Arthrobacter sp. efr-133-R2A-120]